MAYLDDFLIETMKKLDAELDRLLPSAGVEPRRLHEAIRWSTFAGGKRLRPALLIACGKAFGAGDELLLAPAAAVEMMHTFSLIHDDLPAMDDDDLRRGKLTCHKKFDEATAILAGDALQTLSFRTIADHEALDPKVRLDLVSGLAAATGTPTGMVAGQQLDLEAEGTPTSAEGLEAIHQAKTGALIRFSAVAGAEIGGASRSEIKAVAAYADRLGLLFQITDDLLDVTESTEQLGKTAGKDAATEKATYPSLHGVEAARQIAQGTFQQAVAALEPLGERAELLLLIADRTLNRAS